MATSGDPGVVRVIAVKSGLFSRLLANISPPTAATTRYYALVREDEWTTLRNSVEVLEGVPPPGWGEGVWEPLGGRSSQVPDERIDLVQIMCRQDGGVAECNVSHSASPTAWGIPTWCLYGTWSCYWRGVGGPRVISYPKRIKLLALNLGKL